MGQKVNPNGFRIGITHTWPSIWYARGRKYRDAMIQDTQVRRYIKAKLKDAGISDITIDRGKRTTIKIKTSKPGVLIGKQGAGIDQMEKELATKFGGSFIVEAEENRTPDSDAEVVAETIQGQIERRMPYRRAVKMAIEKAMQAGAVGIKVTVSGRLNGAEIARDDLFKEGNVPLQTLRANIQHGTRHAITKFGTIGIQVWVYKGMVFKKVQQIQSSSLTSSSQAA